MNNNKWFVGITCVLLVIASLIVTISNSEIKNIRTTSQCLTQTGLAAKWAYLVLTLVSLILMCVMTYLNRNASNKYTIMGGMLTSIVILVAATILTFTSYTKINEDAINDNTKQCIENDKLFYASTIMTLTSFIIFLPFGIMTLNNY